MPLYDFKCDKCDKVFEIKKSFEDRSAQHCNDCGMEMTRQMTIPAIQFRGSGFYSTDNRKK